MYWKYVKLGIYQWLTSHKTLFSEQKKKSNALLCPLKKGSMSLAHVTTYIHIHWAENPTENNSFRQILSVDQFSFISFLRIRSNCHRLARIFSFRRRNFASGFLHLCWPLWMNGTTKWECRVVWLVTYFQLASVNFVLTDYKQTKRPEDGVMRCDYLMWPGRFVREGGRQGKWVREAVG